jgi:Spy/CpxP family protein refolding chaperone
MKANMEKRGEYDKKLKEILTDEQYQKYEKMHKPHGRHGHHGPKGHGPRGPRPGGFPQE